VRRVSAQHPADPADPVETEELHRSGPEPRSGRSELVGQLLGVGQAGMIVQGGVQEDEAGPSSTGLGSSRGSVLGRGAAVDAMAAARRDPPQLLDVDVDHVTRSGPFVADHRFAQILTRDVEVPEPRDPPA